MRSAVGTAIFSRDEATDHLVEVDLVIDGDGLGLEQASTLATRGSRPKDAIVGSDARREGTFADVDRRASSFAAESDDEVRHRRTARLAAVRP